jgi:mono/diheme cytochrome c family protein
MNAYSTSWTSIWSGYGKIFWLWLLLGTSQPSSGISYYQHVEPILEKHCVQCHQAGEVGPFALDTLAAARQHAQQIVAVTQARYMPPWKPVEPGLRFRHERRLTEAEIGVLANWVKTGMRAGVARRKVNGRKAAMTPADRTWTMPRPFVIPAEGEDPYRCFVVPTGEKEVRYIHSFAFQPGNRRVVHHALFFFDLGGAARRLDEEAEGEGYPCFGSPGFLPAGSLGGWSPGYSRLTMPPGTAVRVPPGADLVMQLHYQPTGRPEEDQSRLYVYFAPGPPARRLIDIGLSSRDIDIPAGEADYRVTDWFETPVDVDLWQIIPHAHLLAREMRAWFVDPEGQRHPVLTITDWDFNWQDIYQLEKPLRLRAGSRLEMEIRYDNSAANPRNPNSPPQRVGWGPGVKDEMAGMHWNVTVVDEAQDLAELTHSLWGKMMRSLQGR